MLSTVLKLNMLDPQADGCMYFGEYSLPGHGCQIATPGIAFHKDRRQGVTGAPAQLKGQVWRRRPRLRRKRPSTEQFSGYRPTHANLGSIYSSTLSGRGQYTTKCPGGAYTMQAQHPLLEGLTTWMPSHTMFFIHHRTDLGLRPKSTK